MVISSEIARFSSKKDNGFLIFKIFRECIYLKI